MYVKIIARLWDSWKIGARKAVHY